MAIVVIISGQVIAVKSVIDLAEKCREQRENR